jgi:hypothetical protein
VAGGPRASGGDGESERPRQRDPSPGWHHRLVQAEHASAIEVALLVVVLGVAVSLAGCAPRRPARAAASACVERADASRRSCFQDCEGEFEEAYVACYGGPSTCTGRCETQQLACQAGPLHDLGVCGEAADNPRSCQERLRAERQACGGRPDRTACEDDAARRAAGCWQACQQTAGPALERCASGFKTCLEGCVAR